MCVRAQDGHFSDNDGLAALVAEQMGAQLLVLLTDVDGVFDMAPSIPGAKLIPTYLPATDVKVCILNTHMCTPTNTSDSCTCSSPCACFSQW